MQDNASKKEEPRILTNMAFWQSRLWTGRTESIYDLRGVDRDPPKRSVFSEAWRLYRARPAYDAVVTMGARESLLYGLLCAFTGRTSRQIMTEVFIDDPKQDNPLWLVKRALYRVVAARSIGILTNSSREIDTMSQRFALPRARFRYVPLGATIPPEAAGEAAEPLVVSAGRTLRDYDTLLQAAPRINASIHILSGDTPPAPGDCPANVSRTPEASYADYLNHLRQSWLVIIPLVPTERSTGQVVMLEAMAMGKPVIITEAPGSVDYIRDGENGYLVSPGDVDAIAQIANALIADPARRRAIGANARTDVERLHSFDHHARLKLDAIEDLHRAATTTRPPDK